MSSTLIAVCVIIAALGMLICYQLGFSAGKKAGFEAGHKDGKKEGSVKAYAVGYDRGRHDREVKKDDEPKEKRSAFPIGCSILFCLFCMLWLPVIALLLRIVGARIHLLGNFASQ